MKLSKIGWCDCTLNPITGCKNFDRPGICGTYCYAARMAKRFHRSFEPAFHPERLQQLKRMRGNGKIVFLDSAADWFCEGVQPEWVHKILDTIDGVPQHHFLVLTKRPERILDALHCRDLPQNLWLGVSVTCQEDMWRISALKEAIPQTTKRFISFEPLHGPINLGSFGGVDWIIIGAETGNSKDKIVPKVQWITDLIAQVPSDIPIFIKQNVYETISWTEIGDYEQFPETLLYAEWKEGRWQ